MTQWVCKVDIKQYLGTETSNEAVRNASRKILEELKSKLPEKWWSLSSDDADGYLQDLLDDLEFAQDDEEITCEAFNYILSELYDWADSRQVWLGLGL